MMECAVANAILEIGVLLFDDDDDNVEKNILEVDNDELV
jgi:hypothetical protein